MSKYNRLFIASMMVGWVGCGGNHQGGSQGGTSSGSSSSSTGGAGGNGNMGGSGGNGGSLETGGFGGFGGSGGMGGLGGIGGIGGMGGAGGSGGAPIDPNAIKMIHTHGSHSCVLFGDGRMKCWGGNVFGELGLEDTNNRGDGPGELGPVLPVVSIGSGKIPTVIDGCEINTAVLLSDGSVKVWGGASGNSYGDSLHRGDAPGEMGDNLPPVDLGTGKTIAQIAGGTYHICALLVDGGIKCWGNNNWGKLGQGTNINAIGDSPGELGDNLPPVDLGMNMGVVALAAGYDHNCVLFEDKRMKCWGRAVFGEIGSGDTMTRGDGPNEMGANLPFVDLGSDKPTTTMSSAYNHTCVIMTGGKVKCWGSNERGQLGLGDTNHRGDQPNEMGDNLPTVDLGTGKTAIALATGRYHTCALLAGGTVKCWGGNANGQIGAGDKQNRGDGPNEMGDNLKEVDLGVGVTVTAISAGLDTTCAVLNGNAIKCWGLNEYGNLGLGDKVNRGDDPGEMGDNLPFVTP